MTTSQAVRESVEEGDDVDTAIPWVGIRLYTAPRLGSQRVGRESPARNPDAPASIDTVAIYSVEPPFGCAAHFLRLRSCGERAMSVLGAIRSTPLVELKNLNSCGSKVRIFAKLEGSNPGGSIKDRPALYMIQAAERDGLAAHPHSRQVPCWHGRETTGLRGPAHGRRGLMKTR